MKHNNLFCFYPSALRSKAKNKINSFEKKNLKSNLNTFNSFKNQNILYTSYSKLSEVKLLTIGIASPLRILQWAEKTLPNGKIYGEVLNANTLHHKTFKPQKGGLFCERIFGPLKDFECACGKIDKSVKKEYENSLFRQSKTSNEKKEGSEVKVFEEKKEVQTRKFCPVCDVEYTWSVIRRYQLGYIKLNSPVTHLWFLKATPSYLSLFLDIKKRHLQFVTYCSETFTIENCLSQKTKKLFFESQTPSKIYESWKTVMDTQSEVDNNKKNNLKEKTNGFTIGSHTGSAQGTTQNSKKRSLKNAVPNKEWKKMDYSVLVSLPTHSWEAAKGLEPIKNTKDSLPLLLDFTLKPNQEREYIKFSFLNKENKQFLKDSTKPSINTLASAFYPEAGKAESQGLTVSLAKGLSEEGNSLTKTIPLKYVKNFLLKRDEKLDLKGDLVKIKQQININENPIYLNSKNPEILKESFNLTNILSTLQLSIYYKTLLKAEQKSLILKAMAGYPLLPFEDQLNSYKFKRIYSMSLLSGNSIFRKNSFYTHLPIKTEATSIHTKLNANLYKILQKLPVSKFILCSLEQKIQRQALQFSIEKSWDCLFKKAYLKALDKIKKIQTKYQKESANYPKGVETKTYLAFENFYLSQSMNLFFEKNENKSLKKYDKFISILLKSNDNLKYNIYKMGGKNLSKIYKNLKKHFYNHAFTILNKNKQPIFSYKYSTSIHNNMSKNLTNLSNDISTILLNKTDWMVNSFSQSLLKYLLFAFCNSITPYIEGVKEYSREDFSRLVLESKGYVAATSNSDGATNFTFGDANNGQRDNSLVFDLKNQTETVSIKKLLENYSNFRSIKKIKKLAFPFETIGSTTVNSPYGSNSAVQAVKGKVTTQLNKNKAIVQKSKSQTKQHLFNTVYTLSHRERWETEKDWFIFSLFNASDVEYLDTPIFVYKKRLFSHSFDFVQESETFNSRNFEETIYSKSFYSGPGIVKQLLNEFNFNELQKFDKQNRLLLYFLNKTIFKLKKHVQILFHDKKTKKELKRLCKKRDLLIRRTKLVRKMFKKDTDPSSMILTVLPVLPPDLRPIVKMGGQIAASDLNRLYQKVIYRNDRLKKFLKDPATSQSYEMKYAQRLLQESVDNLIQNGKSGMNSEKDARGRALKSLSDSLKGKQGRFRQFLLGKRVDYSGRSVIVVGPKLKLHECGLPIEMAKELYLPFLLKTILNKNYAKTVIGAKALIKKNPALTSEILREIMQVSPVLLNRAPTLHRLGFQAFVPKLIEGRAILLHPLVCSAFNADFDGDQMAVHVPITIEARAEAWKLMLSRNNILSPATGDPLAIPSQDMVLGCYYLTTYSNKGTIPLLKGSGVFFNNFDDVIKAYYSQKVNIHAFIWVKWAGFIENGNDQEEPVEIRVTNDGQYQEISANYYRIYDSKRKHLLVTQYVATTPGRILFNYFITKNIE